MGFTLYGVEPDVPFLGNSGHPRQTVFYPAPTQVPRRNPTLDHLKLAVKAVGKSLVLGVPAEILLRFWGL